MKKYIECEDCGGQGTVIVGKLYPSGHFESKEGCDSCGGSGEVEVENPDSRTTAHTPSPWTLDLTYSKPSKSSQAQWIQLEADGKTIGQFNGMHYNVPESEMYANAKLAAAAPELLEICKMFYSLAGATYGKNFEEWPEAKEYHRIISKATE